MTKLLKEMTAGDMRVSKEAVKLIIDCARGVLRSDLGSPVHLGLPWLGAGRGHCVGGL